MLKHFLYIQYLLLLNNSLADDWPACREAVSCSETPLEPPQDSKLLSNNATVTTEFQEATYFCQEYFALPDEQTVYKVICGLSGAYPDPETIVWPVCQPTHCTDAIPTISGFKTGK